MPLAADPNATQRIVLAGDENKNPQPAFIYRVLTYRKWAKLQAMMDNLKNESADAAIRSQFDALAEGLIGWEHIVDPETGQPAAFDAARMPDIVTMFEAQEILMKRLQLALPSVEDKKKLPSPSASDTESSVRDARAL
jgi:hypothetical protein